MASNDARRAADAVADGDGDDDDVALAEAIRRSQETLNDDERELLEAIALSLVRPLRAPKHGKRS